MHKPSLSSEKLQPIEWKNVQLQGGFWGERQRINREVTLPMQYDQCKTTGRFDVFQLMWKPGDPGKPHPFWDSDIAKWIEAAGYSLATHPDSVLEQQVDEVISWIADAQQDDGYLNTYYTLVEPEHRFAKLIFSHELYSAGHLIEAAVAYYQGTGKRQLLDVMCRYADYIAEVFGNKPGQMPGYDGHEEIELALVKLYRVTGVEKYLRLSQFFVDVRGQKPHFFEVQAKQLKQELEQIPWRRDAQGAYSYFQAHKPVREQTSPIGHAVRALYLYSGMTDIAVETSDVELWDVCQKLWEETTRKQMYITGGVGPKQHGERFTFDYDLPNEFSYNETCASIALMMWAHRLLQTDPDRKYSDIIEKTLYNNILGGVSLSGDRFYYANPLTAYPDAYEQHNEPNFAVTLGRQSWFDCACCPPNLARILASLGGYLYSVGNQEIFTHLYIQGKAKVELDSQTWMLEQQTDYPHHGAVRITVTPEAKAEMTLAFRIPQWCRQAAVLINGASIHTDSLIEKGYVKITRVWSPGDVVELNFDMQVQLVEAHPNVRQNAGKVALQRGPFVYCFEEVDNGKNLQDLRLPADAKFHAMFDPELLGGTQVITVTGLRRDLSDWEDGDLYKPAPSKFIEAELKAVPFYARLNRAPGEMTVWVNQG